MEIDDIIGFSSYMVGKDVMMNTGLSLMVEQKLKADKLQLDIIDIIKHQRNRYPVLLMIKSLN